VRTPVYLSLECSPYLISESSPLKEYKSRAGRIEWTDDEIEAIRIALQRLTALRVMNATDAEDLVQDTLLTVVAKCPEIELEKGRLVWSLGILRKKVGNYYRKAQRCTWQQEWEEHAREDLRQSALAHTPEKKIVHEELQGIVERILAQLPGTQRRAMELLIAGLDAGEIARQLHPERYQNVINHLYRGRRKFAMELAKYGYGPNAKPGIIKRFRKQRP